MERLYDVLSKLSFVLLLSWVGLKAFGLVTDDDKTSPAAADPRAGVKGSIWARPVSAASSADDGVAFGPASIFPTR